MKKYMHIKKEILLEYERRNVVILEKVISKELTISEARIELNKILGMTLVKLSEIKTKDF